MFTIPHPFQPLLLLEYYKVEYKLQYCDLYLQEKSHAVDTTSDWNPGEARLEESHWFPGWRGVGKSSPLAAKEDPLPLNTAQGVFILVGSNMPFPFQCVVGKDISYRIPSQGCSNSCWRG